MQLTALRVLRPFPLQIIFYQKNPGIDYEFYVPVEKKEQERERLVDRAREPPRERPREHEPARAPLRSKSFTFLLPFIFLFTAKSLLVLPIQQHKHNSRITLKNFVTGSNELSLIKSFPY